MRLLNSPFCRLCKENSSRTEATRVLSDILAALSARDGHRERGASECLRKEWKKEGRWVGRQLCRRRSTLSHLVDATAGRCMAFLVSSFPVPCLGGNARLGCFSRSQLLVRRYATSEWCNPEGLCCRLVPSKHPSRSPRALKALGTVNWGPLLGHIRQGEREPVADQLLPQHSLPY